MFQFFLYSSGNKKAGWSSLLSFAVAAGFGVMTEIGQGMERQENRVHQRSLESPVLQSALKAIENSTTSLVTIPVSRQVVEKLAYHQYELARCNRHLKTHGQRRVDKCVDYEQKRISRYQAVVDSQTHRQQLELSAQAGTTAQLLQTAKQLERDEKHYHAFIRFLHNLLGFETYLSANFILSLLLVMAFEYAFHYLGNFERDTKAALRERGYEVKRFRHKPPKQQREERAPVQRTLQNQYMPLQQVGFDPLQMTGGVNASAPAKAASPTPKVSQNKRKSTAKSVVNTADKKRQGNTFSSRLIPSSFSTYLGKALSTGTANTPQEVQQFLQRAHTSTPGNSESGSVGNAGKSVSQPLKKVNEPLLRERSGCTRTVPGSVKSESGQSEKVTLKPVSGAGKSVLKSETGTVKSGGESESEKVKSVDGPFLRERPDRTRTVQKCHVAETLKVESGGDCAGEKSVLSYQTDTRKSESGTVKSDGESEFKKVKSVGNDRTRTPQKCNSALIQKVKSTAGQGALSAELQSLADQLYVLWKQQILREQIKPTFRPGKALLNQHLCQDKRRQTPTPLELDSITRQWFVRALQEKVILPNQQKGRGHARYVVNPALIVAV